MNGGGGFSAAADAKAAGYGRIVDHGIAASTIGRGLKELGAPPPVEPGRLRRPGGGRKWRRYLPAFIRAHSRIIVVRAAASWFTTAKSRCIVAASG